VEPAIVRSGDLELAWYSAGEGERAILLVMGLGGRAADWGRQFVSELGRRFRVLSFDNRGTGASSKPRVTWSMRDMAEDSVRVLDAAGVQKAHVIGVSMGGVIAQLLALTHPDRVDHLVLMSTYPGGQKMEPPAPEAREVFVFPTGVPRDEIVRDRMQRITAPGFAAAHPAVIEELVELAIAQPTPTRTFGAQLQAILDAPLAERIGEIRSPTLIVHGDCDPLIPIGNGRAIHERMPQARFQLLPGCGHLAMWEMPDELVRVVLDFLP
jgi:pimeloyl-ACP methyl ester carboxylesterase